MTGMADTAGTTNTEGTADPSGTGLVPAPRHLDTAGRSGPYRDTVRTRTDPELAARLGPEGYRLTTGPDGADITGGGEAGVFWARQTLRQLLGPDEFRRARIRPAAERTVPYVTIEDAPRFRWRGLMLDVARHFMPKHGVLRYVDLIAAHKLNVLHLHLTDDQGWRIEIERHPRLTEVGAWRERTKYGHVASPLWENKPHGGWYTKDDLREIVAYAAERHITVVPEIDIPGHSQAAIAAHPELGCTGEQLPVWDTWGINENVLAPTEATLRFYEEVLEEVLEIFPAPFVHIGGDECPKGQWRTSQAVQARIAELGLRDEDELQSWFIGHFDRWLADRGRRLIGWDEILEGGRPDGPAGTGLSRGAAVASWRGYAGGIAAARAGHDVVMCPQEHVYLDHRQAPGDDEPMPIGYVRTLEDVYRFEPVPPGLGEEEAARVLGTQANVWTEVMENEQRVDYQVFPRLAAFAEVAWSALPPSAERDFAGFESRMTAHYARLDALGVGYRPPAGPLPWQRRPVPEGVSTLGRPKDGAPPIV
ncbi:beta-N-acetylhexosaminidase [Streptomyces sp. Ru87]|nr:beta-N-acetylhexosaminidase [Streptomyces sp. Ru87]